MTKNLRKSANFIKSQKSVNFVKGLQKKKEFYQGITEKVLILLKNQKIHTFYQKIMRKKTNFVKGSQEKWKFCQNSIKKMQILPEVHKTMKVQLFC